MTNFNWILLNIEKHNELRLSRNIDGNTQTTIPIAWLCQWSIKTIKEYCKRENISGYSKINKSFNDKIHYITMILYLNYKKE